MNIRHASDMEIKIIFFLFLLQGKRNDSTVLFQKGFLLQLILIYFFDLILVVNKKKLIIHSAHFSFKEPLEGVVRENGGDHE